MSALRPIRLLLLGAPGSGKGTQTNWLLRDFPAIKSLSSGDVLRNQINQGTAIGQKAARYIESGLLVPDGIMIGLITQQLEVSNWLNSNSSWLIDGFPRTATQARKLDDVLETNDAMINLVVELDVDQSIITERIEARWIHEPSGRVYNLDYNPPKIPFRDDITNEPLVKRKDDTAEVHQKRLDTYNQQILPLKDYYHTKMILHKISGNSSDVIYPKLKQLINNRFGR